MTEVNLNLQNIKFGTAPNVCRLHCRSDNFLTNAIHVCVSKFVALYLYRYTIIHKLNYFNQIEIVAFPVSSPSEIQKIYTYVCLRHFILYYTERSGVTRGGKNG